MLATPTTDHQSVIAAVERLQSGAGTATGDGLDAALDALAAARTSEPVAVTADVEGHVVPVPTDTEAMADVAEQTGGTAFTAASAGELARVYDDIQSRIGSVTEQREILRTFVGVAVVALMAAGTGSLLWSGRFL